ncbi:hypothetical protein XH99_02105 [Bradyrhizobium nanningense]|uniref:Uncharacterized protein n=1 Tax=Bradyrhizobium nanningense TaxID=1325118 RepID=A0A4Q0SHY2_9BRAD|nr:hypothetical protein XH99_02105 [Bradyrhizobium nanningense]
MRDFARCPTVHVFLEDAPDHLCLGLDDDSLAALSRDRSVSVCEATSRQTLLDAACLATPHLVRVVLAIELSDQATKTNQHGVHDAFVDCSDLDAEKR